MLLSTYNNLVAAVYRRLNFTEKNRWLLPLPHHSCHLILSEILPYQVLCTGMTVENFHTAFAESTFPKCCASLAELRVLLRAFQIEVALTDLI